MAQRPKERVRRAILEAAAEELAALGFARTTLARVAARAGTSIGNLYRYFRDKDELLEAAVPPRVARELARRLRGRVEALGEERDALALPPGHPYPTASGALLRFARAHRAQVLFLLERAEGTRYAGFSEGLVRTLTRSGASYARRAYPRAAMTASRRRALRRIYRSFLGAVTASLREEPRGAALEEAIEHFSTYHLSGLRSFFEAAERESRARA